MSSRHLWGFSSEAELDEWVAHCRRVIRRALIRGAYGLGSISGEDIDDVLQDLMCRFAAGCNGNADYMERQYSIAAALAKYALADFWRKKARAGAVAVDPLVLEDLDRSRLIKTRDEAAAAYAVIEPLLPHLTERQRTFLEYVAEHGFDIEDVHGDRARVLERFEMSDGAYRTMMTRIAGVAAALPFPLGGTDLQIVYLIKEVGFTRIIGHIRAEPPIECMCCEFGKELDALDSVKTT